MLQYGNSGTGWWYFGCEKEAAGAGTAEEYGWGGEVGTFFGTGFHCIKDGEDTVRSDCKRDWDQWCRDRAGNCESQRRWPVPDDEAAYQVYVWEREQWIPGDPDGS